MSPHPERAGIGSVLIDLLLVGVVLFCLGILLHTACRVAAAGVRGISRLLRRRGGEDE